MIGLANRDKTFSSIKWHVEQIECELCGEVRLCTEHWSLLACRECQTDFLPSNGFL